MIGSDLYIGNGGFSVKVLVTGASGFVGRNLVVRLLEEGHEVVATSMGGENKIPDGVSKVIYYGLEGIDWTQVGGMDALFHLAANTDTLCHDQKEMWRSNVYGPIALFHRVRDGGCRRIIYASSTAVYGDSPAPYVESETPQNPLNVYGESKKQFDEFAMRMAKDHNEEAAKYNTEFSELEKRYPTSAALTVPKHKDPITIVGLRYCNIYGPGEEHKKHARSVATQMFETMRHGRKFKLFEDGEQKRDWVYVKDVVEANMLALKYEGESDIFNIGTGEACTFNGMASLICRILGDDKNWQLLPEYKECPFPEKYQSHTCCSIEKARTQLGFSPKYNIGAGLRDYQQLTIRHDRV